MIRLARLIRTTAFKLSLAYLVLTGIVAAVLITVIADQTSQLLQGQTSTALQKEVEELDSIFQDDGLQGLVSAVGQRSNRPGSNVYLVTTPLGQPILGNIATLEAGVLERAGLRQAIYTREEGDRLVQNREALVWVFVLPGGFRLVVGRDMAELTRFRELVWRAALLTGIAVLMLGLGGGWFVASRVARRIEAMNATSRSIMSGDLTQRLPLSGSGDEFDRLADAVNAMLTRIEELMRGLKEVSDNIAHDLKTPLTRLRGRTETALRTATTTEELRGVLESSLEETDTLIRTFDALLMIARTESGAGTESLVDVNIAEVARNVVDLYEAVAEEKGLSLKLAAPEQALVHGNRELLAQLLANLIDNAVKYVDRADQLSHNEITLRVAAVGAAIQISVADHGPGIPEAARGRVLERFVRLEESRSQPGAGLGLALVAAIVRMHKGQIELQDNAPGLRVILNLPGSGTETPVDAEPRPRAS